MDRTPNATVINATDGSVAGMIHLGGPPEHAVTDGKGHLYVDMEDKDKIAVVNAKTLKVTTHYYLAGKCSGPDPQTMVILDSDKIITSLPIGRGVDGAVFAAPPTPAPAGERPRRGPMVPDSFTILVVGK